MRRLVGLVLAVAVCWLGFWGLTALVAPKLADAVLDYATPKIRAAGVEVESLEYSGLQVLPTLTGLSAEDVAATFGVLADGDTRLSSSFDARRVTLRLNRPLRLRGELTMEDFEVAFDEADRPRRLPFDRLANARLQITDLPLLAPKTAAQEIYRGLEDLFLENELVGDFEFSGEVVVRVQDHQLPARLYTERQGDYFRLRFSEEDIQRVADAVDVELSRQQIEIVSTFPLRVPFLIDATRQARSLSRQSFPGDRWLRDALRHVAWSLLLTREFGAEFAKEVTDAQETREGNTPQERAMDFHNNAVGRRLAVEGTSLEQLPALVASHPDIIRDPAQVESHPQLLR